MDLKTLCSMSLSENTWIKNHNFYTYYTDTPVLMRNCIKAGVATEKDLKEMKNDKKLFTSRRMNIWIVENILQSLPLDESLNIIFESISVHQSVLIFALKWNLTRENGHIVSGFNYDYPKPKPVRETQDVLRHIEEDCCTKEGWEDLLICMIDFYVQETDSHDYLYDIQCIHDSHDYLYDIQRNPSPPREKCKLIFEYVIYPVHYKYFLQWLYQNEYNQNILIQGVRSKLKDLVCFS